MTVKAVVTDTTGYLSSGRLLGKMKPDAFIPHNWFILAHYDKRPEKKNHLFRDILASDSDLPNFKIW